jgi:hypothetical protein
VAKNRAGTIPEVRPLTDKEQTLVAWLLAHGVPKAESFRRQLQDARIVSRCGCGCASVNFSIDGKQPDESGLDILSDFYWTDNEVESYGVFVFAKGDLLAGLEVYSMSGPTPKVLPKPEALRSWDTPKN